MIIFLILFLIRCALPDFTESGTIPSAFPTTPWNSTDDPILFGHLTDVHLNSFKPSISHKFDLALSHYINLSISTLILTGDLVDNWGDTFSGRYGHQHKPDFDEYLNVWNRHRSKFPFVLDLAGNHDEFGLFSFDSPIHFIRNHSLAFQHRPSSSQQQFWASSHDLDRLSYIALNPYHFPTPHAKFDFWAHPTAEMLDAIEHAVRDKPKIVIGCHYPMSFWIDRSVKSSNGHTFREIISRSAPLIFLSGHTHPSQTQYVHRDGVLEAIGIDLIEHNGFSIVTVDNGRAVHHSFRLGEPPVVIPTHPVPARLLSRAVPFIESPAEIRLLGRFANLSISVRGAAEAKMAVSRQLPNGWWLYSNPLPKLPSGFHRLEFGGDWNHTIDFFVGETLPSFKEPIYEQLNNLFFCQLGAVFVALLNFGILAPSDCLKFGPRRRIRLLPKWVRAVLLSVFLAPAVLPFSFVNIEGHIGVNFWYGYWVGGELFYDVWGQMLLFMYQVGVVLAGSLFASAMAVSDEWRGVFVVDILAAVAGLVAATKFGLEAIGEAAGKFFVWTSPLFVWSPIMLYTALFLWRVIEGPRFFRGDTGQMGSEKKEREKNGNWG